MHATAKEPADRYKTAEEMAADLSTALSAERADELPWQPTAMLDETKVLTPIQPEDLPVEKPVEEEKKEEPVPEEKPKKKKKRKRFILLFLLLLLAAGGATAYLLTSSAEVTIPQVEDMTEAQARAALKDAKLTVDSRADEVPSDTIKKGRVVKTDPEAGTMIKKTQTVRLYVSSGTKKVTLKDYKGESIDDAEADLRNIGFSLSNIRIKKVNDEEIPADQILTQNPKVGTKVDPKNDEIVFEVSKGPKTIEIGDYTGWNYQDAQERLLSLGITEDQINISRVSDEVVAVNEVISQNPVSGTGVTTKDTVTLKVSSGSANVTLEDLTGKDKAEAKAEIEALGLTYNETQEFSSEVEAGKVISTNPGAGSVKRGSSVTVVVSKGPEETEEAPKNYTITIDASFTGTDDQQDAFIVSVKDAENPSLKQKLTFNLDKNMKSTKQTVSVAIAEGGSATVEVQRNGKEAVTKEVQGTETVTVP